MRSGDFALRKWPGEKNPADILTKAVIVDLIDRHLQFVNLHWEDAGPRAHLSLMGSAGACWALAQLLQGAGLR
eukprot:6083271-Alexandrium_andersonii.AAC.1